MTKFIGLSGKKQAGKNTSATILTELLESRGREVITTSFAKPLKEMCINVLGLKREYVYGNNEQKNNLTHIKWNTLPQYIREKYNPTFILGKGIGTHELPDLFKYKPNLGLMTVREVMQVVGTDIFREMLYGDVWANAPFLQDWSAYDYVIFDDVRFPNEKTVTEAQGGIIIRIERNTGLPVDNHLSETALDQTEFEFIVQNNGTIEELRSYYESTILPQT